MPDQRGDLDFNPIQLFLRATWFHLQLFENGGCQHDALAALLDTSKFLSTGDRNATIRRADLNRVAKPHLGSLVPQ